MVVYVQRICLLLWAILFLAACRQTPGTGDATGPAPLLNEEESNVPHLLISPQGAALRRVAWNAFHHVSVGTPVMRGDLLQADAANPAQVLCADLSLSVVTETDGIDCPTAGTIWAENGFRYHLRSPATDLPSVISPRGSALLNTHPLLQWQDTGSAAYSVRIRDELGALVWQEDEVGDNQMRYPDDAPSLQPGQRYILEVVDPTTGRSSADEVAPNRFFRIVNTEEREVIEQRRDAILALPIDSAAQALVLGMTYVSNGLYAEALPELVRAAANLDGPTPHLWQGRAHMATGLQELASRAFAQALAAAQNAGDIEAEAAAQEGMWWATHDQDARAEALRLYEELGDQARAEALREAAP